MTSVLSVAQIAEDLGVTDATVRLWINSGSLPALKLPGSGSQSIIRVQRKDYEAFKQLYKTRVLHPVHTAYRRA